MSEIIGKKELCEALKWSRPKLDRRLQGDEHFPIVSRGDQAGGWKFRLQDVLDYLNGVTRPAAGKGGKRKAKPTVAKAAKPPPPAKPATRRSAEHSGEATAKQRKDNAEATLRELQVAQKAGELVQRAEVSNLLHQIFGGLAQNLEALPEEIVKKCDLPDTCIPTIYKVVDSIRRTMVSTATPLLQND